MLLVPFEVKFLSDRFAMFEEESVVKSAFPEMRRGFYFCQKINYTDSKRADVTLMYIPTIKVTEFLRN